ncbi:hypothetical protein C4568_00900 [Candidatus Parcubacteria bacterium]|nr:MAG: hypothetical protein C4568_00900 [Candidatus Parcubacteria bacterium]
MRSSRKKITAFGQFSRIYAVIGVLLIAVLGIAYFYQSAPPYDASCLPFEKQDNQEGYCYATCEDEPSCAALDEQYKIVQDTFTNGERILYYNSSPIPIPVPEDGFGPSDDTIYTIHSVKNGTLGEMSEFSTQLYEEYSQPTWNLISLVLPEIASRYVTEFAGFFDYAGGTGAFVLPTDETSQTWSININYAYFYTWRNTLFDRGDSIHTLLHEIGHIITLGDAFDPGTYKYDIEGNLNENRPKCYTTQFFEGCSKVGSPLAIFAARFWPEAKGEGDASGPYSPEKFVSAYAATNIAEDVAESWAAFVLLDKPAGDTLAERKILFFYEFPEFVAARADILKNIHRLH